MLSKEILTMDLSHIKGFGNIFNLNFKGEMIAQGDPKHLLNFV